MDNQEPIHSAAPPLQLVKFPLIIRLEVSHSLRSVQAQRLPIAIEKRHATRVAAQGLLDSYAWLASNSTQLSVTTEPTAWEGKRFLARQSVDTADTKSARKLLFLRQKLRIHNWIQDQRNVARHVY